MKSIGSSKKFDSGPLNIDAVDIASNVMHALICVDSGQPNIDAVDIASNVMHALMHALLMTVISVI